MGVVEEVGRLGRAEGLFAGDHFRVGVKIVEKVPFPLGPDVAYIVASVETSTSMDDEPIELVTIFSSICKVGAVNGKLLFDRDEPFIFPSPKSGSISVSTKSLERNREERGMVVVEMVEVCHLLSIHQFVMTRRYLSPHLLIQKVL